MPVEPQIEEQYENLLTELRTLIESDGFLVRHRQSKTDFVRNRCLSFVVVVFMLINMLKRSVQDELDELFRLFSGDEVADRSVTKSAFSQARQKLKHTAFIELNQTQVAHTYSHFAVERWHDRRLLGLDGSLADVPNTEANRREFGSWGSRHGTQTAKARLSQLFDVLNDITVDGIIAPKRQGERVLAKQHLDHVQPGDVLLLDRGYPAFWLFLAIVDRGADFCARLEVNKWQAAQAFVASGAADQVVSLPLCSTSQTLCRQHGFVCDTFVCRLIRGALPNEVEVLATSLCDAGHFPTACFAHLYQQRWPVEIVFTQMTKGERFSIGTGGDDIADFHLPVVDDDPVHQQFDQLPALGEGQLVQGRLNAVAEVLDPGGVDGQTTLLVGLGVELAELVLQALLGCGQFLAFALELLKRNDLGQIGIQQARLLSFQVGQGLLQSPTAGLKRLGQPLAGLSALEFMGNQGRVRQNLTEVLPDQIVQGLGGCIASRTAFALGGAQAIGATATEIVGIARTDHPPHTGKLTLSTTHQAA
jgi:hypothetical protein